jgi:hypothetical protein
MNGNLPPPPDDEGLDRDLIQMFAEAREPLAEDAFVSSVLLNMQRARRAHLLWQAASLVLIMTLTAFMAPYVAQQTLQLAGWFTEGLPATGTALLSPIGCACAALIAWLITRRARTH